MTKRGKENLKISAYLFFWMLFTAFALFIPTSIGLKVLPYMIFGLLMLICFTFFYKNVVAPVCPALKRVVKEEWLMLALAVMTVFFAVFENRYIENRRRKVELEIKKELQKYKKS